MRQWSAGKDEGSKLAAAQRIAEAVRFLHSNGLIHRDLKPENIVFDSAAADAAPALCDFDLSRSANLSSHTTTRIGTPLYVPPFAPEQLRPTFKSDIFSLGVTLFDALLCGAGGLPKTGTGELDLERMRGGSSGPCELTLAYPGGGEDLAALLRQMLSPEQQDRPTAAEVADRLSAQLNQRTCLLCHCPYPRDEGLVCPVAGAAHFTCDGCMAAHVAQADSLGGDAFDRIVCCDKRYTGCTGSFSWQEVMGHVDALSAETLRKHLRDAVAVQQREAIEAEFKQREAEREARSEVERKALKARRHIEEDIMALKCPRRAIEGTLDTGYSMDAHQHVPVCSLNPSRSHYIDVADWKRIVDGERGRKLEEYWRGLAVEVQEKLAIDGCVRQILRELRLGRLGATSRFAAGLVQLRGMGFSDERKMRTMLDTYEGNVERAAEALASA
ncbi:hypothetical protein EMIHUDRAFT_226709 [Emiliania huxleyi CCMP1516]|uniref:Protein kinase domain-containing protein n=2 Tax=Emiliania huxleyi TaxID=2903 RepID=A0A0D3KK56_EMIH1|nr:hypothetical protein EMIHUDRAFT_226709 [Emiliania huxleyi CCMP1516]EOD36141.1 hypothetical protein EMIHUDRAFT_226709 [Emiliania huxleyi CCMP1516]|eukprot:XP_005788570.1 hypothetical protein EMIHUDRAFT_226709 [Emiliania huxleyi CCMP1516]